MSKPFLVTTAIPYPNDKPHVGFMYEIVAADVVARAHRLMGDEVFFLTGLDENSQNILDKALSLKEDPKAFCDRIAAAYREILGQVGISNDDFVRTTESRHHQACTELWKKLAAGGHIYKGKYEGWYCDSCNNYWEEKDLKNGACPEHGTPAKKLSEENYFFALSKWQKWLEEFHAAQPDFVHPPERRNEVLGILKEGLKDVSFSRANRSWGIPVPGDPGQVMYVWADALVNYITALGYGADNKKMKFWPATHLIGKDITRFHSLLWPAMLKAAGLEPPRRIAVHGHLNIDGRKISKTLGNVIYADDVVRDYGPDALRYCLLADTPYGPDGDFSHAGFIQRYNSDLANDLGNLLNRIGGMTAKYAGGKLPEFKGKAYPGEEEIPATFASLASEAPALIHALDFPGYLSRVFLAVRRTNKLIEEVAPWKRLKEGDQEGALRLLPLVHEVLRQSALFLQPFLPASAPKIYSGLGLTWPEKPMLSPWKPSDQGLDIPPPKALFPRIETK